LATTTGARAAPAFFVEAEVDSAAPWVQAQATLRLRFFQGADVRDIELAGPPARLADIRPLGAATVGEAVRDGRRYRVHERHFAILPFASGRLELAEAHASGRLPGSARRSHWSAPVIALEVRPAPAGITDWLPARALRLAESWSAAANAPAVGQPLLRTVRIEATGVAATLLPEIRFDVPGASVLARPPRIETRVAGTTLHASREQDFEILPTRAGALEIPSLHLAWWKVGAGATAVAQLPGQIFEIPGTPTLATAATPRTPWLFPVMGLALLLFAARFTFRHRLLWKLWLANRKNDRAALKACLLDWGRQHWENDPPSSLIAIANRLSDAGTAQALRQLDAALYGKEIGRSVGRLPSAVLLRIYLRNA
jgi:hypothetical protein